MAKKELPTSEQVAAAAAPAPLPPPAPAILCAFCGREPENRQVANVWVHVDELQTIVGTIRATLQRAAGAPVEATETQGGAT